MRKSKRVSKTRDARADEGQPLGRRQLFSKIGAAGAAPVLTQAVLASAPSKSLAQTTSSDEPLRLYIAKRKKDNLKNILLVSKNGKKNGSSDNWKKDSPPFVKESVRWLFRHMISDLPTGGMVFEWRYRPLLEKGRERPDEGCSCGCGCGCGG